MIKWKKGDPNNLAGKLFLYTRIIDNSEEAPNYLGIYCSTNPLDVVVLKEGFISQEAEDQWEEMKKRIKQRESNKVIPLFSEVFPSDEEYEVEKIDGDVLETIPMKNPNIFFQLHHHIVTAYMITYETQKEFKTKIKKTKVKFTDNYKNYKREKLKRKYYFLVGGLYRAIDNKREKDLLDCSAKIKKFSQGAPYFSLVDKMVDVAKTNHPKKVKIVESYIDSFLAILDENYELAAQKRDEIRDLWEN